MLSCAKSLFFCETQHRQVAALRKSQPDPQVELHPDTAAARGIAAGDWVSIDTPKGSVRARAKLNAQPRPGGRVRPARLVGGVRRSWVCPAIRPTAPAAANLNLVLSQTPSDPISGSSPLAGAFAKFCGE